MVELPKFHLSGIGMRRFHVGSMQVATRVAVWVNPGVAIGLALVGICYKHGYRLAHL